MQVRCSSVSSLSHFLFVSIIENHKIRVSKRPIFSYLPLNAQGHLHSDET